MTEAARNVIVAVLAVAWLIGRVQPTEADSPPWVYVPEIIDTWDTQAPEHRDEVGFALSVAFVSWPSLFLRHMHERPGTFHAWLDSLKQHTLKRTAEPGRAVWVVKEMHRLAERWDGVRYRDMTEAIRQTTERLLRERAANQRR